MASRLKEEIKQAKPFSSSAEEAFLNVIRTADALNRALSDTLKPHGISPTQYNVLRILRGAGAAGHTCGDIGDRMITRDPDITRLLDRMEKRGLLTRSRESKDRRVITTRISPEGLQLLKQIDPVVERFHRACLHELSERKLNDLSRLLESVRCVVAGEAGE